MVNSMKKNVLLVTYGGGHCMMMIPVFKYLQEQDICRVAILGLTTAGKVLRAHNIPYLSYKDFIRPGDEEALNWGKELALKTHTDHSGMPLEESIAYLGFSFADLVTEHGFASALAMYQEKGRYIFNPTQFLTRIIQELKPDVIVATNSPRSERAALEVARMQGIPNISMINLFEKVSSYQLKAQHVCIISPEVISNFEAQGCKAENYHITGNPAMDRAFIYQGPIQYSWRREHFPSLSDASKTLLFDAHHHHIIASTQALYVKSEATTYEELKQLAKVCADLDLALFIRPHPNQSSDPFKKWIAKQDTCQVFLADAENCELYPLLNASDIIVSHSSTIMLEALYMGRTVVQLDYPDSVYTYRYDQAGFAWFTSLNNPKYLKSCLLDALTNSQKKQEIQQRFSEQYPGGLAAPKVGELIKSLL